MGVTVAITRVACETDAAPNTQDITTADLGDLTPKAAIFIVSYAVTDGIAASDAIMSIGAATGTSNRWAVCGIDEDNLDTSDTEGFVDLTHCIYLEDNGGVDGSADLDSFIENGVRIAWDNAPSSAYLLTVILFAGSDLSAHAGNQVILTENNAYDITDPGFEPNDVFVVAGKNNSGHWDYSSGLGLVHNDGEGGITQRAISKFWRNAVGTSDTAARNTNSGGALRCKYDGALDWYAEFSDFDANGFSITPRNDSADNTQMCYLALNYNGAVSSWVGTHTTPTSGGNNSEEGPGFTPQFVLILVNLAEAIDTAYTDNRGGSFGIAVFDADNEY